uniref:Uncharacterized protein n=1 Tax=Anguilla anguilla TaxID=7936 RepID=A0A0E9QZS7_ANGAN
MSMKNYFFKKITVMLWKSICGAIPLLL